MRVNNQSSASSLFLVFFLVLCVCIASFSCGFSGSAPILKCCGYSFICASLWRRLQNTQLQTLHFSFSDKLFQSLFDELPFCFLKLLGSLLGSHVKNIYGKIPTSNVIISIAHNKHIFCYASLCIVSPFI